ncbi:hypothetical protein [Promicromonospora iranensis]|uniref:Uncharacterized protein n=1 Tax=Promicromonospora iranensis TaxID=1105144 RepID=A0ABU2CUE1_9MICO|nr:hypothetical protein [Promicromonospora iranensis]MDR7384964.1 hypothetical protein [Promicromonospora iranensis]
MGRGTALVEQDHVRRVLMWEKGTPDGRIIGMVDSVEQMVGWFQPGDRGVRRPGWWAGPRTPRCA